MADNCDEASDQIQPKWRKRKKQRTWHKYNTYISNKHTRRRKRKCLVSNIAKARNALKVKRSVSASGNTSQVVIATAAATPPSADNEGTLPDPAEQAWNIASALQLPSQSRSSTRTRTEK